MPFTETIASIPFTTTSQTATGFFPPLLRGMGHILYLTGCVADEAVTVTDEQAIEELTHALEHWTARASTENVSTAARDRATVIGTAIGQALTEFTGWAQDQRISNLRDLSNRIVAYTAELDRELVGIANSDPGSAL